MAALFFIARREHLLNEVQHSAVGNPLSDQGQELLVVHRSEEVLQIRIDDPLASALHFAPDLAQGVGGFATLPIPEAARIEDFLEDRLQAIDQRLLADPIVDRGYAQRPRLAGTSSLWNLQSSHGLRSIGVLAKFSMQLVQSLLQPAFERLDRHLVYAAGSLIGANALPRKL